MMCRIRECGEVWLFRWFWRSSVIKAWKIASILHLIEPIPGLAAVKASKSRDLLAFDMEGTEKAVVAPEKREYSQPLQGAEVLKHMDGGAINGSLFVLLHKRNGCQQPLIMCNILFPDSLIQRFATVKPIDQRACRDKPIAKSMRDMQQEFVEFVRDQAIS